jgi:hypothetical protein
MNKSVTEIKVSDLQVNYPKKTGVPAVYCWGYYDFNTFIPLYVGKSRNVHERLLQHYCNFKSGQYRIFSADELRDIYINKTNTNIKLNAIYTPLSIKNVIDELPNIKEHDLMIKNFTFRYLPVTDENDRVHAERSLANHVGRGRLITNVPSGGDHNLSDILKSLVS